MKIMLVLAINLRNALSTKLISFTLKMSSDPYAFLYDPTAEAKLTAAEIRKRINELAIGDEIRAKAWSDRWATKAVAEFHISRETFDIIGEANWSPFERYLWLKRRSNDTRLVTLRKFAMHWDLNKEKITQHYWEDDPELEHATEKEIDDYFQDLIDTVDEEFTPANHLILQYEQEWYRYNKTVDDDTIRVDVHEKLETLIRGYKDAGVTYNDILTACRGFLRKGFSGRIDGVRFLGFSEEGYEILSISIDW
jgi:hypothetical protein